MGLSELGRRLVEACNAKGILVDLAHSTGPSVDRIGAEHVAFGADIEGIGPNWAVNGYGHARSVVEYLQETKLPDSVIERVACANYARVLGAALK